jgi:putative ATP-dependent endonuclease of OLD family
MLQGRLGDLLLRWEQGCLEENILPLFKHDDLRRVIEDHEGDRTGMRLRTLADRLGIRDSTFEAVADVAAGRGGLMTFIVQAATGYVPDSIVDDKAKSKTFKAHARQWFKSIEGGKELAEKMFEFGVWPSVSSKIQPFVGAIRMTLDMPPLSENQA